MQGPVVQPFSYDESHPYASGQHRGIDIGADATGETVVAPAAGTVSFAGTVPTNGKTVTIETADGYSVTLTHLGSIAVTEGATVGEQQAVGTVGPSGTPEVDGPYVHLGIRVTADPNGYVDPLEPPPCRPRRAVERRPARPRRSRAQAPRPHPRASPRARCRRRRRARGWQAPEDRAPSRSGAGSGSASSGRSAPEKPRTQTRGTRSQHRSVVRDRASEPTASSFRRPVAEPTVPRPIGLDAGHEPRPGVSLATPRREPSSPLPGLVCNGAAALFALGAVFAARRRRSGARPATNAQVLRLPPP